MIAIITNHTFRKKVKNMGMQKKKPDKSIFLYMTSQHLRKVVVGQKHHKHDFPKLEN